MLLSDVVDFFGCLADLVCADKAEANTEANHDQNSDHYKDSDKTGLLLLVEATHP